ncbi:hypothetical protein B0H63DRAFT_477477 [Podospora didyma]|uniref:Uncharacterized protein n=1 Tax=Podospora didyma TaxID=330526 RepID=A0AAE0KKK2_9PEZI|nr:hypothetical protein B0H63DRAFT_477477 [Podospora didyma]
MESTSKTRPKMGNGDASVDDFDVADILQVSGTKRQTARDENVAHRLTTASSSRVATAQNVGFQRSQRMGTSLDRQFGSNLQSGLQTGMAMQMDLGTGMEMQIERTAAQVVDTPPAALPQAETNPCHPDSKIDHDALAEELTESNKTIAQQDAAIQHLSSDVEWLEQTLEHVQFELKCARAEAAADAQEMREKQDALEERVENLTRQCDERSASIETLQNRLKEFSDRYVQQDTRINTLETTSRDLAAQRDEMSSRIPILEAAVKEASTHHAQYIAELKSRGIETTALLHRARLEALEEAEKTLGDKWSVVKKEWDVQFANMERSIESLVAYFRVTCKPGDDEETRKHELVLQVKDLAMRRLRLLLWVREKQTDNNKLEEKVASQEKNIKALQSEVNGFTGWNIELQEKAEDLEKELNGVRKNLGAMTHAKEDLGQELRTVSADLRSAQTKVSELESSVAQKEMALETQNQDGQQQQHQQQQTQISGHVPTSLGISTGFDICMAFGGAMSPERFALIDFVRDQMQRRHTYVIEVAPISSPTVKVFQVGPLRHSENSLISSITTTMTNTSNTAGGTQSHPTTGSSVKNTNEGASPNRFPPAVPEPATSAQVTSLRRQSAHSNLSLEPPSAGSTSSSQTSSMPCQHGQSVHSSQSLEPPIVVATSSSQSDPTPRQRGGFFTIRRKDLVRQKGGKDGDKN